MTKETTLLVKMPSGDYINPAHVSRLTSAYGKTTIFYSNGDASSEEIPLDECARLLYPAKEKIND